MSATPLYRGQGNKPFDTARPVSAAKRGQTVPYDVNGKPAGATLGGQRSLDISIVNLPGSSAADPLIRFRLREQWVVAAGASVADSGVPAVASSVFRIRKDGVQVGTVTFAAGGSTGTIAFTDSTFPAGSLFELYPPSTIDAALDRVSITLAVTPS
jgi:hypothetical protein